MGMAHAIFAAGCFWGVQASFDMAPGVISTEVGYIGGKVEKPTYEMVCTDKTGHAEAVKVTYDTDKISYEELLDIFFDIHDPTTKDKQGPDIGSQYRSAIFYVDDAQKEAAEKKIKDLDAAKIFKSPVVTQVVKAPEFYPAEEYHQKYNQKRCGGPACSMPQKMPASIEKQIKEKLTPEQYHVLREKGTEKAFTGKYLNNKEPGTYRCAVCGNEIFKSDDKYDSKSGWPSFDKAIPGSIKLKPDYSHGMVRTEVVCGRCGSHLGHMFDDGPTETGERFCINSISMDFDKK